MKHLFCIFSLIFITLPASFIANAAPEPSIRILIAKKPDKITITSDGAGFTIETQPGRTFQRRSSTLTVFAADQGLRIDGENFEASILTITNRTSVYRIDNRSFQGKISVAASKDRELQIINELPLEAYLIGLMNSEISFTWPTEAIKAQAVAARTYALATMERTREKNPAALYDMTATMLDQVYAGDHPDDDRVAEDVAATRGEVIKRKGKILATHYHSCCGGQTEYAHHVWANTDGPPLTVDRFCERSPKLLWDYSIPLDEFREVLKDQGTSLTRMTDLKVQLFDDSPRVKDLIVIDAQGEHPIAATDLRKWFGYGNIKSTWFNVALEKKSIDFAGRGYGHGVGMCQWGAKGMAEAGHSYRDILKFYYADGQLATAY
ncbi:MAG: SpoIID/LytB domain-containing protein [Deltaproteobacteria bacterium]|nr:SpoIID/LytB domain-containing protein [Deltaproteobacteria bacterium]